MSVNKIYSQIFEKNKVLDPNGRLVFQLIETMGKNNNGAANAYKYNKKTHATLTKKFFIPLYLEHIRFLVKRAGWNVT